MTFQLGRETLDQTHLKGMDTVAERLLYVRHYKGITQVELAKRVKLSSRYFSMVELGYREPSDIVISAVCNELNVNETWLRTGEGEPFFNSGDDLQKTFAAGLQRPEKGIQKLEEIPRPRALFQLRVGRFFVGLFCNIKSKTSA